MLARRGFAVAPLQDPRVGALLGMSRDESLRELRFLLSDGRHLAGADAILAIAREIWWARPLVWFSSIPGTVNLLHVGYHWVAEQRNCAAINGEVVEISRK